MGYINSNLLINANQIKITTMNSFGLKSTSFKNGEIIPSKFTCEGDNINPFLEIKNIPKDAKSLALIVEDIDATRGGVFDHWILWNIPSDTHYIEEDSTPFHAIVGINGFGNKKYGGPCPPPGVSSHRYIFKLFALNDLLDKEINNKENLLTAITSHLIEKTELLGLYSRK